MDFINKLHMLLQIAFIFNFIATIFIVKPKLVEISPQDDRNWTWKNSLKLAIIILSFILLIVISLVLNINFKFRWLWGIIVYAGFFRQVANTLAYVSIFGRALSKGATGSLKQIEHEALLMLTVLLIYLFGYGTFERVHTYIAIYPNKIYSDWMTAILFFLAISIYTFFICALAINPITFLTTIAKKYLRPFGKKTSALILKLLDYNKEYLKRNLFCSILIEKAAKKTTTLKIALSLLVIPAAAIDIFAGIVQLFTTFLSAILWYVFFIFKWICSKFYNVAILITSLSDRTIDAICFRSSIVIGLGCTVIINRYESIFHNTHESTAVLEFISSVIIIPIVLEWISTYTKSKSIETK